MKLDTSTWRNDDKEWLKSRKDEWNKIQKNLKSMKGWLRGSYLKHHKALYFEGEIDDQLYRYVGGNEFGKALPLFIMWYHPDRSLERYQEVFEEWVVISSGALTNSRRLLFEFPCEEFFTPYGMLGGREELIVRTLNPSNNVDDASAGDKAKRTYSLSLSSSDIAQYCVGGIQPHIAERKINKFSPGQYLWSSLCTNIQNIEEDTHKNWCKGLLQKILNYDFDNNDQDSTGYHLARKFLNQYESRDLPEPMLAFWDGARAELG